MKTLFILSLFKQGYKIKVSTLYHLLKGKRTVSVLMSGFLYDNFNSFHLFADLKEDTFYQLLRKLVEEGFILFDQESLEAEITELGLIYLQENEGSFSSYTNHLDGYRYARREEEMWRMLQFLVQVFSHLSYQSNRYIPLESSPYYQLQIKKLLSEINREKASSLMREEWSIVLERLSKDESRFIIQQFSGYRLNGKAEQQLLTGSSAFEKALYKTNVYHHLFKEIETLPKSSVLYQAISDSLEKNKNQSMLQTKRLWLMGHSLRDIAEIRKMKLSTVNDHFLEMAMSEENPLFEQLIPEEQQKIFQKVEAPYQNWRFAKLRQQVEVDYFSFRMYQIIQIKKERGT